jgi:hypothetical protein
MKIFSFATASLFALLVLGANFNAKADYVIKQSIDTGTGKTIDTVSYLKGHQVRVDTGTAISVIEDTSTGDVNILSSSSKTVQKVSGAQAKLLQKGLKLAGNNAKPELKPTGNHETINGFPCEEFTFSMLGNEVHVFIDKDFPNYQKVLEAMKEMNSGAQMATNPMPFDQFKGMPIKTIITVMGRKMATTLVSADEKPVDDSHFVVPADYTERAPGSLHGHQ